MRRSGVAIFVPLVLLLSVLVGCASGPGVSPGGLSQGAPARSGPKVAPEDVSARDRPSGEESFAGSSSPEESSPPEERFVTLSRGRPGRRAILSPPGGGGRPSARTYDIEIDFENADLLTLLEVLLKRTLGKNYVVDPQVRAKVTAHIAGSFTEEELLEILSGVLRMQNLALKEAGGVYHITQLNRVGNLPGGYSFAVIKPRYVSAERLLQIVKAFVSQQARVMSLKGGNVLVIVDARENLKRVVEVVSLLDQDFLAGFHLELYRPRVLEAEELERYLQRIFRSGLLRTVNPQGFVDFVAVKEVNALIVIARDERTMRKVKNWILQLDTGETLERRVFIYYVENGDAEEMARILQEAFGEFGSSERRTVVKAKKTTGGPDFLAGKVRIIPDKTNNLLVINASPEDYRKILGILKEIDIVPRQVLIEVLIAEISLNKDLEYGVEWWLKSNFNIEGRKYFGDVVSVNKYSGRPGKGFSFTVYRNLDPRFLISALSEVSRVHILSNPVILATDNKKAKIQIGEEVPTVTQNVVNTGAQNPNITQNIQYRDVGIILEVKPHINSGGLVKLDVVQEISSVSDKTVQGVSSPLFSKRRIETSLVVQDGQTVIFGGLIQNQNSRSSSGVPGLKSVPVIGGLFKWQSTRSNRKELLIAITPRVVRSAEEAERVMKRYRERIEELKRKLAREGDR